MIKTKKKLSYKEWLDVHGNESCEGCQWHLPQRAACGWKERECIRYYYYLSKDANRY